MSKITGSYSQIKKIPTFVGLFFLILGLAIGIIFINRARIFGTRASSEISPQQIKITNIGSSSFVVSWTTVEKISGFVNFGESENLGESQKDIRDNNISQSVPYPLHYILIDNLKPETKYFFKIVSGGKIYNRFFDATTAPAKIPPDNDISQGKILTADNMPASGAIVYFSLPNTTTQSALTDSLGNWIIPLSTARTPDLSDFSNYDRSAQIAEILVLGEKETANATFTTANDNPVPNITLGQSYNFLSQMPEIKPIITQPTQAFTNGFATPSGTSTFTQETELSIIFPTKDNENINSLKPEFFGTGPKGQQLDIQIESEETIKTKIPADSEGKWNWSPKTSLSTGEHTITVSYTDSQGFIKKVTRSFTVLAAGQSDLPSFTATPSGNLATPSPAASPTASLQPSPTNLPTLVPTATEIPSRTSVITGPENAPASGNFSSTGFFLGSGLASILIGLALILF